MKPSIENQIENILEQIYPYYLSFNEICSKLSFSKEQIKRAIYRCNTLKGTIVQSRSSEFQGIKYRWYDNLNEKGWWDK